MKERPILFSAPMVRAILDGRKTQTRRIIKNIGIVPGIGEVLNGSDDAKEWPDFCPYGKQGDRLWVRETHWMDKRDILCAVMDLDGFAVDAHPAGRNKFVKDFHSLKNNKFWKKRPSIHMPRIVSRILLEITGVRVERLQDISECDAKAEGSYVCDYFGRRLLDQSSNQGCYKWGYRSIWESINGTGSWDLNPFVWVVEFKVLEIKHGRGAALFAKNNYGAVYGVGVGRTGSAYGIPTKDINISTLPIDEIKKYVDDFVLYAKNNPDIYFQVTNIGCGLAGYNPKQIAPMFIDSPSNCFFSKEFTDIINETTKTKHIG